MFSSQLLAQVGGGGGEVEAVVGCSSLPQDVAAAPATVAVRESTSAGSGGSVVCANCTVPGCPLASHYRLTGQSSRLAMCASEQRLRLEEEVRSPVVGCSLGCELF
jgi:hypothetical protein